MGDTLETIAKKWAEAVRETSRARSDYEAAAERLANCGRAQVDLKARLDAKVAEIEGGPIARDGMELAA